MYIYLFTQSYLYIYCIFYTLLYFIYTILYHTHALSCLLTTYHEGQEAIVERFTVSSRGGIVPAGNIVWNKAQFINDKIECGNQSETLPHVLCHCGPHATTRQLRYNRIVEQLAAASRLSGDTRINQSNRAEIDALAFAVMAHTTSCIVLDHLRPDRVGWLTRQR